MSEMMDAAEELVRPLKDRPVRVDREMLSLALQLRFAFEVGATRFGLMSASPERPCDYVGGLDAALCEFYGDAADFLD